MSRSYARTFLKKHHLLSVPFNIDDCLHKLNVSIRYNYYGDFGAFLVITKTNKYIVVNKNLPVEYLRFFIAHEISHLILNHRGIMIKHILNYANSFYYQEKCADECARELLMPGQKLREYANFFKFDVQALKSFFKVSELNMVIKMKRLGLPYCNSTLKL